MKPTHILYADASDTIGLGHVARMFALAEELSASRNVAFATNTWDYVRQRVPHWPCPVIAGEPVPREGLHGGSRVAAPMARRAGPNERARLRVDGVVGAAEARPVA